MNKTIVFKGDPHAVFKKFYGRPGLFFLDSSQTRGEGRFSYIGFSPYTTVTGHDLAQLKKYFHAHKKSAKLPGLAGGGAVGYLGYDGRFHFGFYAVILTFDHAKGTLSIHAPDQRAVKDISDVLASPDGRIPPAGPLKSRIAFKSNLNKSRYMAAVKKALAHIRRGDIYQINLSRRVDVLIKGDVDRLTLYGALRAYSPSPFAAYYDDGKLSVLSSSPERFLKLSKGIAQIKPMKGTRPRGKNSVQDKRFKEDLLKSPKEIAELLMVTDLERNDLGRVCAYGSVKVKAMRSIEAYKTVFQATATIEGRLHKKFNAFDLIEATFPGGSVTGCPKIEAMKIIGQLEAGPRGLYTGALGYIAFDGSMDFAVLIRSLFVTKGKISFHVGGGIVADSSPAAEYEETRVKAKAMEHALTVSLRGTK